VDVLSGLQQPDTALLQRAALSMPRTDMAVAVTNRGSYFTGGCGIPADPLGRPLLVSVSTYSLPNTLVVCAAHLQSMLPLLH
jgi:hypothetical protein